MVITLLMYEMEKDMPLSEKEIHTLIEKLRDKYRTYGKQHSPRWFDINAFDDRLQIALRNRMNLEGFILAEITNFEKVREKYEKKRAVRPFSERVDRIIEENLERIKKYPRILFHSNMGVEISHFYGAGADLTHFIFPIIGYIVRDEPGKTIIKRFEEKMDFLFYFQGEKYSKRIEDHALLLSRRGVKEIEIEKDKNEYMKEAAFVLHDIIDYLDSLMKPGNREWELPIRFDRLFFEGKKKKKLVDNFAGHTTYGAVLKVKDSAEEIISDFRLSAFRRR